MLFVFFSKSLTHNKKVNRPTSFMLTYITITFSFILSAK